MKKKNYRRVKKIEKAGAFSLVLECIAEKTAKKITKINKYTNNWNRFLKIL